MKIVKRPLIASALCLTGLLVGCASLPPLEQVTLAPPQTQRPAARPSDWTVRRVLVPEYLNNYNIEVRDGDYTLLQLPGAKWAVRLPIAMTNLLQEVIDEQLVHDRNKPDVVHVCVNTFELQPSNNVVLNADWRITNGENQVVAQSSALIKESVAPGRARNPAAVAQAMSQAVRELGAQIVKQAG